MTRVYTRSFDWDEARRLRAAGMSMKEIAERLGVTPTAVYFACDDEKYELAKRRATEWNANGQCRVCGGKATRKSLDHEGRCRDCANRAQATSVREDTLRCATCREWKPDDAFPHNRDESLLRRGRHGQCTACGTAAKRDYRRRNREKANAYDREYKRSRRAAAG